MKKPLEEAWVGPHAGWGGVLGNHQHKVNVVARLLETQIQCLALPKGEDSAKEQWLLPVLLFGRKLFFQPLP